MNEKIKRSLNLNNFVFLGVVLFFGLLRTNAAWQPWQIAMLAILSYRLIVFSFESVFKDLDRDRERLRIRRKWRRT